MARQFGATDNIVLSPGALATASRAGTVIAVFKREASNGGVIQTSEGGTERAWWGFDSTKMYAAGDFGAGGPTITNDVWCCGAWTKASGSNAYDYYERESFSGAFTHVGSGFVVGDGTASADAVTIAGGQGSDKGNVVAAAIAHFATVLDVATIAALDWSSVPAWLALGPNGAWQFNQASIASTVNDLTAGHADQVSISGTTVVADPPGFTYSSPATTYPFYGTAAAISATSAEIAADLVVSGTVVGASSTSLTLTPEPVPEPSVTINLTLPNFVGLVTGIGQCVNDALAQTPAGAPDRFCPLVPTQTIPWDSCDCGGQLALAIQQMYGSDTFPQPFVNQTWAKCKPRWWVAQVIVSVTRCVPTLSDVGVPPSCTDELAAAITLANDMQAARQGIACCLTGLYESRQIGAWTLGLSATVGELGGCAGSETTLWLGMQTCPCPG
jgi:hypothetical protein